MRKAHLVLLAALVASSSFAWIQKEDLSNLSRAKQYVTRADSAIKRANSILDKGADEHAIKSATKQADDATEHLEKAKERLDGVSSGFPGKSQVESDYNESSRSLETLKQRLNGAGNTISDTAKTQEDGFAKDGNAVEALSELLPLVAVNIRATNTDIELIRNYPRMKAEALAFHEKYGKRTGRAGNEDPSLRQFKMRAAGLKNEVENVESNIQKLAKENYKQIDKLSSDLKQMVDRDVAEKNIPQFGQVYPRTMEQVLNKGEMYEILCKDLPGYDPGVRERAIAAVKYTEESLRKLELEVIKSNVPPVDRYAGGDKGALTDQIKKVYMARYPKAQIVKVVFPADSWSRTVAWKWRNDGWYKEDASVLNVFVLVKGIDPAHVYTVPCQFIRDHVSNQLSAIVPIGLEKPTANFIVLASKVK